MTEGSLRGKDETDITLDVLEERFYSYLGEFGVGGGINDFILKSNQVENQGHF